jgi:hypothetical protein
MKSGKTTKDKIILTYKRRKATKITQEDSLFTKDKGLAERSYSRGP